ncbi:RNA-directed DNA polymerase, eukaryota, reverse transcriptase zinc-binding domain protein [Tanacetum coccineum]
MKDNDSVSDLVKDGVWDWPLDWLDLYPSLKQVNVPAFSMRKDSIVWIEESKEVEYSVSVAWRCLRDKWPLVEWRYVVWFSQCNPKQAFILWLAIQEKLLTQDKMLIWNSSLDLKCPFCKTCPDDHNHLFFDCQYSTKVWQHMRSKGRFSSNHLNLKRVVEWLATKKGRNNIWLILNKLILAATVYFLWIERNKRIFKDEARKSDELITIIKRHMVDMLMSLTVKSSRAVVQAARIWDLTIEKDRLVGILLEGVCSPSDDAFSDLFLRILVRMQLLVHSWVELMVWKCSHGVMVGELGELFGEKTVRWSVLPLLICCLSEL